MQYQQFLWCIPIKRTSEAKEWIPDYWKYFSGLIVADCINKWVVGKCDPVDLQWINSNTTSKGAKCSTARQGQHLAVAELWDCTTICNVTVHREKNQTLFGINSVFLLSSRTFSFSRKGKAHSHTSSQNLQFHFWVFNSCDLNGSFPVPVQH